MSVIVKLSSQLKTERKPNSSMNEPLTADMVKDWIDALPDEAVITPLTENRGDFRETYPVFVGLQAAWEEHRS